MPDAPSLDAPVDSATATPPRAPEIEPLVAAIEHYVGIKALDVAMSLQDERTDYTTAIQQARDHLRHQLTAFLAAARAR